MLQTSAKILLGTRSRPSGPLPQAWPWMGSPHSTLYVNAHVALLQLTVQIISHSSVLLDAHLPNFLAYEPSFDSLARLQSAIEPLLALQEDFDRLRAPIDAVITLARREERRLEEEAKKAARNSKADKASRQTGTDKGGIRKGGRLPEEMVGKWRVEDFVF